MTKALSAAGSISTSPAGERFSLPLPDHYQAELCRVEALVQRARGEGKEVVVVMGLGFVGAVMAAVIADAQDAQGKDSKFVIGCQRPSVRSYWKVPLLNRGEAPVKAEDPNVELIIGRCVREKGTLTATFHRDCLKYADCVVVDVQCDFIKNEIGNSRSGTVDMKALEATLHTIGERIPPSCLVIIETTVPPGTTENIAWPILKKAFTGRGIVSDPLLAHSFERVMPGRHYVASIRDFWRVCAGCTPEARDRVVNFLNEVLNTEDYPLTVMDRPIESETTKIVENSYRATLLAFMDEWSTFAERSGVDLIKVIEAIRERPTHDDILFPGPGIGGYCLPKDGGLGYWGYRYILGYNDGDRVFKITPTAIDINDKRALHVVDLVADVLQAGGGDLTGAKMLVCGASYRQDVGDTRYSGSEMIVRKLAEQGAQIRVHDPYVEHWYELENQEENAEKGNSWKRFFHNQDGLAQTRIERDLQRALKGVHVLVLAVPHKPYLDLDPDSVVQWAGHPLGVIDCFGMLSDVQIRRYLALGCKVKALGRGHIERIQKEIEDESLGKKAAPQE